MQVIRHWINQSLARMLPTPQALSFLVILLLGGFIIIRLSDMLLPVMIAVVIAYLLEGLVRFGEREKLPRNLSVMLVFLLFMASLLFVLVALLPVLYKQSMQLVSQMPVWIAEVQTLLNTLPERYPEYVTQEHLQEVIYSLRRELLNLGHAMLSMSFSSILGILTVGIYLILVPLLVFLLMIDKIRILGWCAQYLPEERDLWLKVWREVDAQLGNYIRGKVFEIVALFVVSHLVFSLFGLNYALLLAVIMGISVIIPYVGATLVTLPVFMVGFFQWGLSEQFAWLALAYAVVQALDGMLLVPLLFSEVVNLHPVAIMLAILFFGDLWGFWGVFFAIPLATLIKAILSAWPHINDASARRPSSGVF
ncbi:MAG: hypothetical protein RIQ52_1310 [Pseudomonadota bacterium]